MYIGRLHNFLVGGAKKGITTTLGVFLALAIAANTALIPTKVHAATALQATEASITDKSATASAEIVTTDGNSITDGTTIRSKVTFTRANDFVTYRVRIDNVTDKAYTVEAITDDNTSANVTYEYDQHAGATLPATAAFYFDVTARYVATPSLDDRNQSINVRFHFTLKDIETNEEIEEELLIVPDTGTSEQAEKTANAKRQNLILYFDIAVFIIIVVALIVKFTKNKKAKLIIPIVALIGTVTGFIVSAAEFPFELIITSEYSYKDRLAVTYEVDGEEQVIAVSNGDTLENKIEDPSKTGYTFTGWLDENNEPVDLTQPIEDDTKIHAAFTPISYILHIDIDDDYNFALTVPLKYDEEYTLPEVDHSLWYIDEYHYGWFDDGPDWNTEEDDHYYTVSQVVKNLATVDGAEIWLETEWRPRILAATYLDFYDDELVAQLPTKVSYVYFDDHGGEIPLPHPLEREGYRLKWFEINGHPQYQGLYPDYLEDEDTYTVKAVWEKKALNICYRVYGRVDEFEGQTECDSVEYGEEYEVRENYFIHYGHDAVEGWSTTPEGTTIAYAFGATLDPNSYINDCGNINYCELSLYAIWTPRTTTLHFTPGDGVTDATGTVSDVTFTYGQPAALNANNVFKRPGYTLNSWNCGDAGTYAPYFTADGWTYYATYEATCKANWDANRYHIQFEPNADDTTGQMTGITAFYGGDTNLTPNSFERTGYTFIGWKKDNTGELIADQSSAGQFAVSSGATVTLYAQWKELAATLNTGSRVKNTLKSINANATSFTHYAGTPDLDAIDGEQDIALTTSSFPVYAWNDNGTIYWWSEAETVYINASNSNMFDSMNKLETVNLSGLDHTMMEDASDMFKGTTNLQTVTGMENWRGENLTAARNMFADSGIVSVDIHNLITSSVTALNNMFYNCPNLTTVNASNWDISGVEIMYDMFNKTPNLETITGIETWEGKKLRSAISMFENSGITELNVNKLVTASTEAIDRMFYSAGITSLNTSNWDTSNVVTMTNTFYNSKINTLNLTHWNTSSVEDMTGLFASAQATTIDVSNWNTQEVAFMSSMFRNTKAETLNLSSFNTSNVIDMGGMFWGSALTALDISNFNTEKVDDMHYMFNAASNLETLDISGFNTTNVTNMEHLFSSATALNTVYASDLFVINDGADEFEMLYNTGLIGGAGTQIEEEAESIYARIDDPDNNAPGAFTLKNARYIRYDANEPYGETATGQTQSHYASSVAPYTQVQTNGFTIEGYRFLGWGTSPDSVVVYEPGALIDDIDASKEPYTLYAKWEQVVPPTLMQSMLNDKLKEIVAAAGATDDDVVAVKEATNPPAEQLIDDNVISSPESSYKIWAYYTEGTIWIYTEDGLTPHAPDMLGNMLSGFPNLTDVSWLSKLDVSNTTDISSLFDQDTSLTDISPLANWDTSKLFSILGTFRGTAISDLSPIATKTCGDKTCWDTSSLEEISSAFQRMTNLSDLSPLATWNVSKLNDLSFAFYDTENLIDFSAISGWRLKTTEDITMLMTFDNRNADYSVLEDWFSERTNGTEGLTMTSAFPNIGSAKLPSWAR